MYRASVLISILGHKAINILSPIKYLVDGLECHIYYRIYSLWNPKKFRNNSVKHINFINTNVCHISVTLEIQEKMKSGFILWRISSSQLHGNMSHDYGSVWTGPDYIYVWSTVSMQGESNHSSPCRLNRRRRGYLPGCVKLWADQLNEQQSILSRPNTKGVHMSWLSHLNYF